MSHTVRHKKMLLTRLKKIQGRVPRWKKCSTATMNVPKCYSNWRRFVGGKRHDDAGDSGHLTDHVVKEPEETQREADLDVVMQVIKSYLK